MTALTGFMAFLKFVSELDLDSRSRLNLGKPRPACEHFSALELYLPIFPEQSQDLNIFNFLWRVSTASLEQLREQAVLSLRILQSPSSLETSIATASFRSVFLQKSSFFQDYDLIFHIPCVDQAAISSAENLTPKLTEIKNSALVALDDLTPWQYTSTHARDVILQALGNRASKVHTFTSTRYVFCFSLPSLS
jgi:hypothetical protein